MVMIFWLAEFTGFGMCSSGGVCLCVMSAWSHCWVAAALGQAPAWRQQLEGSDVIILLPWRPVVPRHLQKSKGGGKSLGWVGHSAAVTRRNIAANTTGTRQVTSRPPHWADVCMEKHLKNDRIQQLSGLREFDSHNEIPIYYDFWFEVYDFNFSSLTAGPYWIKILAL